MARLTCARESVGAAAGEDGVPNDWYLVHLGARASGGFGLVIAEATAVVPEGRISSRDTGSWNDEQVTAWRRVTDFVHARGTLVGVQLAHAGRKASTYPLFAVAPDGQAGHGSVPVADGGWTTVGPSALAFPGRAAPDALSTAQIADLPGAFAAAARRALAAGFDVVELRAAHELGVENDRAGWQPQYVRGTWRWSSVGGRADYRPCAASATAAATTAVTSGWNTLGTM